jgi:low affinity Fe/Cu permease
MAPQKNQMLAQIAVAVIVGLVGSIISGTGTAFVMTQKFDKKLDAHIIQNQSVESQIRRDIARIEQANVTRDKDISSLEKAMSTIAADIAFIRGKFEK